MLPAYAAFIITYRRNTDLQKTIQKLKKQTHPPRYILVVDNDADGGALSVVEMFPRAFVGHFKVGYNSGPAGAAYCGLRNLFDAGWEWVLWMDDDDPPPFHDAVEQVFAIVDQVEDASKIGALGAVGTFFNPHSGKTLRIQDHKAHGILEVDHVAGGMLLLVSRAAYLSNVFPDKDLFFGFEELSFCLRMKEKKLNILISGELLMRYRKNANRLGYKRKLLNKINDVSIWRQYYSTRNMLRILIEHRFYSGVIVFTLKNIIKLFAGYRYGFSYGIQLGSYISKGLIDGYRGRMGLTILPKEK